MRSSSETQPPNDRPHTARGLKAEGTAHLPARVPSGPALRLSARREEPHLARFPPPLATLPGRTPAALLVPRDVYAPGSQPPHLCSPQPGPLLARRERGGA